MPKPRNPYAPKRLTGTKPGLAPRPEKIRLNKWLAETGHCSRREADRLIQEGAVSVNGRIETTMGSLVNPETVRVCIKGHPVSRRRTRQYVAFHKPTGLISTRHDPQERATIYDRLPPAYAHLDPVGRLDRDSSGLLLLTDDGDWLYRLSHPKFHVPKTYRVTVSQILIPKRLKPLLEGVLFTPEDVKARAIRYSILEPKRLELVLETGYNRQIRRMLEAIGYEVVRLKRTAIGPLHLGHLAPGACRPLTHEELYWFKRRNNSL